MGDIADAMLDGDLCEGCGVPNEGESHGVPWRCPGCMKDAPKDPPARKHPGRAERARAKAAKGEPLPKWKLESPLLVAVRYHCTRCQRHFATEPAAVDHLRDVHGVSLP